MREELCVVSVTSADRRQKRVSCLSSRALKLTLHKVPVVSLPAGDSLAVKMF